MIRNLIIFLLIVGAMIPAESKMPVEATAKYQIIPGDSLVRVYPEANYYEARDIIEDCNAHPEEYRKVGSVILKDTCISDCANTKWTINGISMTPTIADKSLLSVIEGTNFTFFKGQVIVYNRALEKSGVTYTSPYEMYIHRIVDFQGEDLVVMGDANQFCELLPRNAVKGIVRDIY